MHGCCWDPVDRCDIPPENRTDVAGCTFDNYGDNCWRPSAVPGTPWCFLKADDVPWCYHAAVTADTTMSPMQSATTPTIETEELSYSTTEHPLTSTTTETESTTRQFSTYSPTISTFADESTSAFVVEESTPQSLSSTTTSTDDSVSTVPAGGESTTMELSTMSPSTSATEYDTTTQNAVTDASKSGDAATVTCGRMSTVSVALILVICDIILRTCRRRGRVEDVK